MCNKLYGISHLRWFLQRWKNCTCHCSCTANVRNPIASLCASGILQTHCSCHCARQYIVQLLFMSLYALGILQRHCSHHCARQHCVQLLFTLLSTNFLPQKLSMHCSRDYSHNFDHTNYQCIVHVTIEGIMIVKIVDAMTTVGSIRNHDSINQSSNIFFYTEKTLHNKSFKITFNLQTLFSYNTPYCHHGKQKLKCPCHSLLQCLCSRL